ncbi:hypothetical protein ACLOJK_024693 [Asimina triloba]
MEEDERSKRVWGSGWLLLFCTHLHLYHPHDAHIFSPLPPHLPNNSSQSMALLASPHPDSQPQFHVLAVDDSLIDRKLIEKLLRTSSYQVTAVDSGRKALEFLGLQDEQMDPPALSHAQDIEVHLIITDYWMPGMTGYDLLKKIKNSSSLKDIPVVIMSSENVPSRINRCLEEGAEEFFLKPVQLSDVKKLQPHLLKGKPREQSQPQQKQLLSPTLQQQWLPLPQQQWLPLPLPPPQQQPQARQLLQPQEFSNKRKAMDECMTVANTRQRCEGQR